MVYIYFPVFHPPRLPVDIDEQLEASDFFLHWYLYEIHLLVTELNKGSQKAIDDLDASLGGILHIKSILESRIKKIQFFLDLFRPT